MALEKISSTTKVGEINKAIEIWKKVSNGPGNTEEKKYAQSKIEKLEYSKIKIINLCKSKVGTVIEDSKKRQLAHLMKDDFKELSIEKLNAILLAGDQVDVKDSELQGNNVGMNILEGKTGIEFMTVVKSTIAVSAVALLSQYGAFSAIGSGFTALWALNPVVAACAAVLGTASLIKLARKIFAPEISRFVAKQKADKKFNTQSSTSDQEVNDFISEEETKETNEQNETARQEAERVDKAKNNIIKDMKTAARGGTPKTVDDALIQGYVTSLGITEEQVKEALTTYGWRESDTAKADYSSTYNSIVTLTPEEKTGYRLFKNQYNNAVVQIMDNTKTDREKNELIGNIRNFANNDANFVATGASATMNAKLKELCGYMCDMLGELLDRSREFDGVQAKNIRKQLETEHGLKANDLYNLTR